jgi:hypothetical protein
MHYGQFLDLVKRKGVDWRFKAVRGELQDVKYDANDEAIVRYKSFYKGKKDELCESTAFLYENLFFRRQIEALILIEYTDEEIAEAFSVSVPVISMFRQMFFDIPPNLGNLIKKYLAQSDKDVEGKELKITAVKYGKEFLNFWLMDDDKPIQDIAKEFQLIQKSLLSKLKGLDKINLNSIGFRNALKAIEILFADVHKKREGDVAEKFVDALTGLATGKKPKFPKKEELEKKDG